MGWARAFGQMQAASMRGLIVLDKDPQRVMAGVGLPEDTEGSVFGEEAYPAVKVTTVGEMAVLGNRAPDQILPGRLKLLARHRQLSFLAVRPSMKPIGRNRPRNPNRKDR